MKKEYWKLIKDYENYMVSSFGRVKSINYNHSGKERILKLRTDRYGYLRVNLWKNNKQKNFLVHRLIAEAFLPNPNNYPCVNHRDENKQNNNVINLEWCNSKYNCNFGTRNTRMAKKLSKPILQYTINGLFIREWKSAREAGRNGFNQGHITECCRGKRKYHKDCIWRYKNEENN